ncbi:class I glutamine amidotransferase-like protein [Panus rudis PR-1116 ss-1]|nr:class I glutamine amidotransferase-like protein [Panus rudis PR-1116 ss-1]
MSRTTLKIAVTLFPGVNTLDYAGPIEVLSTLSPELLATGLIGDSPYDVESTYFGYTKDPIKPMAGPKVIPDKTYDEVGAGEQYDVIVVPGGFGSEPQNVKPPVLSFLQKQAPGAKYVLSVCTGSWLLAQAGLLEGKRATTNRALFKRVQEATSNVQWDPKARWVVDGKYWTAAGVTAGIDTAYAFLENLVGKELTTKARALLEYNVRSQEDTEFAQYNGLL